MSLIWDLLRKTEEASLGQATASRVRMFIERRKGLRAIHYVPLFVYGHRSGEEPFHEDTNTVQTSGNGGLLRLEANVRCGQKLLLINRVTEQEQECTVVRLTRQARRAHVGIAFAQPAANFWRTDR